MADLIHADSIHADSIHADTIDPECLADIESYTNDDSAYKIMADIMTQMTEDLQKCRMETASLKIQMLNMRDAYCDDIEKTQQHLEHLKSQNVNKILTDMRVHMMHSLEKITAQIKQNQKQNEERILNIERETRGFISEYARKNRI
jgi:Mg2+ and Co2+ transporter CorA